MPTGSQVPDAGQSPGPGVRVEVSGPLPPEQATQVLALVQDAAEEDGVSPLSEHVLLHLRYGGDLHARNVLVWQDGRLAGYGHLDPTDPVEGPAAEMVVDPAARRQGLGVILGAAISAEAGNGGLRLWAHGELPAAARLASAAGFTRARALWQMRRSLQTRIGRPQLADGIRVRTFVPGQDEQAWIALNHRAFARHPEQGAWTRADLELREREPWFDADGFFLAERDSGLAGFHWTKIHGGTRDPEHAAPGHTGPGHTESEHTEPEHTGPGLTKPEHTGPGHTEPEHTGPEVPAQLGLPAGHGHEAIGEVYVVGVDPDERGTGLGRALTLIGLRYLRGRGLAQVMLYVDETNSAAIGLYESLGFTHWDTDVMYSRQPG